MRVGRIAKAIVAAAAAGMSTLTLALADGNLTNGEGVTIALAVLGSLGITYVVPNQTHSN